MFRVAAVTAAATAVAMAVSAGEGSAARGFCGLPSGAKVLASSTTAVVSGSGSGQATACWRATGRRTRLDEQQNTSPLLDTSPRLSGRYVAYALQRQDEEPTLDGYAPIVAVRDLTDGKLVARVCASTASSARSEADLYDCADTDHLIGSLAIDPRGDVAWIEYAQRRGSTRTIRVLPRRAPRSRRAAAGTHIRARGLTITGHRLSWVERRQRRVIPIQ